MYVCMLCFVMFCFVILRNFMYVCMYVCRYVCRYVGM